MNTSELLHPNLREMTDDLKYGLERLLRGLDREVGGIRKPTIRRPLQSAGNRCLAGNRYKNTFEYSLAPFGFLGRYQVDMILSTHPDYGPIYKPEIYVYFTDYSEETSDEEKAWIKALQKDPGIHTLGAYCDWLEERVDDRWMYKHLLETAVEARDRPDKQPNGDDESFMMRCRMLSMQMDLNLSPLTWRLIAFCKKEDALVERIEVNQNGTTKVVYPEEE